MRERSKESAPARHSPSSSEKEEKKEFSISPLARSLVSESVRAGATLGFPRARGRAPAIRSPIRRGRTGSPGARSGDEVVAAEAAGLRAAAARAAGGPRPRPGPLHRRRGCGGRAPLGCPGAGFHLFFISLRGCVSWRASELGWAGESVGTAEILRGRSGGGPGLAFAAGCVRYGCWPVGFRGIGSACWLNLMVRSWLNCMGILVCGSVCSIQRTQLEVVGGSQREKGG